MNAKVRINPIAKEVQDTFDGIYAQTVNFVQNPNSAINGLIISGDAGTGKTYTTKKALIDTNHQKNVEYIKGGKITAATHKIPRGGIQTVLAASRVSIRNVET